MSQAAKPKTHALTIYLLKKTVANAKAALKGPAGLTEHLVGSDGAVGTMYLSVSSPRPPRWAMMLAGKATPKLPQLSGTPSSAVLFIKRKGRTFAVTFGYGRHLIAPGAWEENFGLIVTLNSVAADKIRSIDVRSFDAISRHTRTQASREGSVQEFGMDVEQDLLRAATGTPSDKTLGGRLTGMDALHVSVPVSVDELPALLERYTEKFLDQGYRKTYPWIDQIAEVRDLAELAKLDEKLVERLRAGELEHVWMAAPDILDWTDIDGFRYPGETEDDDIHPDLHAREYLKAVEDPKKVSVEDLRSHRIRCIAASASSPRETWTAYHCIYCEISDSADTYLLSAGKWYRVAKDLVGEVNAAVKKLVLDDEPLPSFVASDVTEVGYNKRVAKAEPARFAHLDAKSIMFGGGRSRIEVCDLLSKDGQMIHVKRYAGSSVLSHLFAQGLIAGTIFMREEAFRAAVKKILPASHRSLVPTARPARDAFEVVYAVVSRSNKPVAAALPFFSKLNLRNAAGALEAIGFRVRLAKIRMS